MTELPAMIPYLDSQYKYLSLMIMDPVKRAAQQIPIPDMPTLSQWPGGGGPINMFTRITRSDSSEQKEDESIEDDDDVFMERDPWLRADGERAVREHFIPTPNPSSASVSALGTEDEEAEMTISNNDSFAADFERSSTVESEVKERVCDKEYDPSREREEILEGATEGLDDWDIIQSSDVSYHRNSALTPSPQSKSKRGGGGGSTGASGNDSHHHSDGTNESTKLLQTSLEDTFHKMTRALNIHDKREHGFRYLVPPMKDDDFKKHLDEEGRLVKADELRLQIYQIGVEHSLRKVVWKHLLNVYPTSPNILTGAERYEYMRIKCLEYHKLKKRWQNMCWESKKKVVSSIRKDVLRTDRSHAFYSDIEVDFEKNPTNPHLTSLFDILMTFAMSFPQISYCQGMSDLASPLLLIMQDEAVTYVCFCALMRRLQQNFTIDSKAMQIKFDHLKLLLRYVDPELHHYLAKGSETFEMFFCYRWLLLEMKREFALDDALLMLEVMWASIPPNPPDSGGIQMCNSDILATLDTTCSTFNSPSHRGDSHDVKIPSEIDPACAYKLASLDAANYDLIEWSKDQNSKSNLTSPDTSNFDHLRSKVPSNETDTMSHRSSLSIDSDDVYRNSLGDDFNPNSVNIENLKQSDFLSNINSCNSTVTNLHSEGDFSSNIPNDASFEVAETKSSANCPSLTYIKNSSNQIAAAAKSQPSSSGSKSTRNRAMSHATSCPSLDEISDTSDLGTAESSLDGNSCMPGSENITTPTLQNGNSSCMNQITSGSSKDSTTPMSSHNNAQYSKGHTGMSAVPTTPNEMKRTKSSVDISPQSWKEGNVEFSYDLVEDVEAAQLNDLGAHKVVLPIPAEFGCGNPFLLFMCVTLIIQQKQKIVSQDMDLTDVSGFFFRLVRGHDVHKVLSHARMLFADYLRTQPWTLDSDC